MDELREMKLGDLMENEDQVVRATAHRLYNTLSGVRIRSLAQRIGAPFVSTMPKGRPPSTVPPLRK